MNLCKKHEMVKISKPKLLPYEQKGSSKAMKKGTKTI